MSSPPVWWDGSVDAGVQRALAMGAPLPPGFTEQNPGFSNVYRGANDEGRGALTEVYQGYQAQQAANAMAEQERRRREQAAAAARRPGPKEAALQQEYAARDAAAAAQAPAAAAQPRAPLFPEPAAWTMPDRSEDPEAFDYVSQFSPQFQQEAYQHYQQQNPRKRTPKRPPSGACYGGTCQRGAQALSGASH